MQKQWRGTDPYGGKFDRVINYQFNAIGELSLIVEGGYVHYKKPDKKMSYKKPSKIGRASCRERV